MYVLGHFEMLHQLLGIFLFIIKDIWVDFVFFLSQTRANHFPWSTPPLNKTYWLANNVGILGDRNAVEVSLLEVILTDRNCVSIWQYKLELLSQFWEWSVPNPEVSLLELSIWKANSTSK